MREKDIERKECVESIYPKGITTDILKGGTKDFPDQGKTSEVMVMMIKMKWRRRRLRNMSAATWKKT